VTVELFTGAAPAGGDATAASGGLVRAFESDPAACRVAAASLAELRASATLRGWAGYREIGAVYLLPPGDDPAGCVRIVDELLPGSARVLGRRELTAEYPLRGLAAGTTAVVERHAGYLSPARLRAAVLAELAAGGCVIRDRAVAAVTATAGGPAVRLAGNPVHGHHTAHGYGVGRGHEPAPGCGPAGGHHPPDSHDAVRGYDAVVVAAGAWTAGILAAGGLPGDGFRTRQIQYSLHAVRLPELGAFVEHESGFYGRPADGGAFLLGLPSPRWDVTPGAVEADAVLTERVTAYAIRRFGAQLAGPPVRTVASLDCYHQPPGLALRRVLAGTPVFTFTGGSGGAAKAALAASRTAAAALLAELAASTPRAAAPAVPGRPTAHPVNTGTPTATAAGPPRTPPTTPTVAPGRPTAQPMNAGTPTATAAGPPPTTPTVAPGRPAAESMNAGTPTAGAAGGRAAPGGQGGGWPA
jgi:hypothetical protein